MWYTYRGRKGNACDGNDSGRKIRLELVPMASLYPFQSLEGLKVTAFEQILQVHEKYTLPLNRNQG